jgi:DAK2 domain fusion protein YloV
VPDADRVDALDAAAVRRWVAAAVEALEEHRPELDRLNVFPIADSDTGTNLVLTMRAGLDALAADSSERAGDCLAVLARGAVLGARGNSGVILSQLLRSLADTAGGRPSVDAATLRDGLRLGAEEARTAVNDPVEGTILTVARAAADAVPPDARSAREVVVRAQAAAEDAVRRTPEQLPELARAGVVDAGGRGFAVVLAALVRTLGGQAETETIRALPHASAGHETFAYEVQYLLEADDTAADKLRAELATLGDSVVVVGTGDGIWNVHAHVDDAGAAVEAGVLAGRPYRISVVKFADADPDAAATAVIAVSPGEGLSRLFEGEGVHVVAGPSPGTEDVLGAITAAGAQRVVLLPNASQITGVAEAAAERARNAGVRVAVVPTRSPVQGLAAIAVHDPNRGFDDDVVAMAEAAAATRFAEVTVATQQALTAVGVCAPGDVLGLIDGEVVDIGHGLVSVAFALTDRLLGVGAELMTVLVGADAQTGMGEVIARHVRERSPLTEVTVYDVGQPRYPLIIGVE